MAVQAHATAKYIRTSAQKAGLVIDLIRGRDVNAALATLRFARKSVAQRHREGAAVGDCQRAAERRVRRRRRAAVRERVLREPGAVAEADSPCADGPRVPRGQAHRALTVQVAERPSAAMAAAEAEVVGPSESAGKPATSAPKRPRGAKPKARPAARKTASAGKKKAAGGARKKAASGQAKKTAKS